MVQGDRDDNHSHANSFVRQLKNFSCNGKPYLYIKSDHPAYQGIMSMTLAAKITNKKVEVIANTSKVLSSATEISIVIIK